MTSHSDCSRHNAFPDTERLYICRSSEAVNAELLNMWPAYLPSIRPKHLSTTLAEKCTALGQCIVLEGHRQRLCNSLQQHDKLQQHHCPPAKIVLGTRTVKSWSQLMVTIMVCVTSP